MRPLGVCPGYKAPESAEELEEAAARVFLQDRRDDPLREAWDRPGVVAYGGAVRAALVEATTGFRDLARDLDLLATDQGAAELLAGSSWVGLGAGRCSRYFGSSSTVSYDLTVFRELLQEDTLVDLVCSSTYSVEHAWYSDGRVRWSSEAFPGGHEQLATELAEKVLRRVKPKTDFFSSPLGQEKHRRKMAAAGWTEAPP